MKTKKIIKKLRRESEYLLQGSHPERAELPTAAANRLEMLSVELKNLNVKLKAVTAERDELLAKNDVEKRGGINNDQ